MTAFRKLVNHLVWIRPFFKNYTYTIRRGLAKGLKRKGGLSFIPGPSAQSLEDEFLRSFNLEGKVVYDIGAFEGIFSLFFAKSVGSHGQVITFEANPNNYNIVLKNIALNHFRNIMVKNIALGDKPGKLTLAFGSSEAGSGSLNADIQERARQAKDVQTVEVSVDTLDNQVKIHNLPQPDFIKIDVEGFEPQILAGMKKVLQEVKPVFFIELHGFMMTNSRDEYWQSLTDILFEYNYSVKHIETNEEILPSTTKPPLDGHLFCTPSKID